jgi:hypothetical protein
VVVLPPSKDLQAALPTAGRYTQDVFGEGVRVRVPSWTRIEPFC